MPYQVMDAFKNLIRHGKHAKAAATTSTSTSTASPISKEYAPSAAPPVPAKTVQHSSPKSRRQEPPQHIDLPNEHEQPRATQGPDGHVAFANQPPIQTPYAKEAEMIVKEERETKNKMPVYKGLERFKLLEKMGDGAFSEVYKALDLTSGQKVALKIVRKFELNASQVSAEVLIFSFFSFLPWALGVVP
ncbi:hypothetical protein FRC02_000804 [Tulasnella sp. 418]|nr:hypothetical protein FRC02_000804 [Tulasnella sp. 418]